MKKFIALFVIGYSIISFSSPVFAQADAAPQSAAGQQWFCLKSANHPGDGHGADLSTHSVGDAKGRPYDTNEPVTSKVWVFVKIGEGTENSGQGLLSTGDRATDALKLGDEWAANNYDKMKASYGFDEVGQAGLVNAANPVAAVGGGELDGSPVYWHDDLHAQSHIHYWFGMQEVNATGEGSEAGSVGGLQNSNFDFDKAKASGDCLFINWDPVGYVYDSKTLGPVKGVSLLVKRKNEAGEFVAVPVGFGEGKVAKNPVVTDASGRYEFYSSPGTYTIEVLSPHKIATQTVAGYEKYGYNTPLTEGKSFVETEGNVARVDLTVETVSAPAPTQYSSTAEPKLAIDELHLSNSTNTEGEAAWTITGRANIIPSDVVVVYQSLDGTLAKEVRYPLTANRTQAWSVNDVVKSKDKHFFLVKKEQKILADDKTTELFFTLPIKITQPAGLGEEPRTVIASSTQKINVLPSYIEGIAKNKAGVPLVNAIIGIYLTNSSKPTYQTKTDENGRYTIDSRWTPPLEYSIKTVSSTGEIQSISIVDYLKQNQAFHTEEKINPFVGKTSSRPLQATLLAGEDAKRAVLAAQIIEGSEKKNNSVGKSRNTVNTSGSLSSRDTVNQEKKSVGVSGMVNNLQSVAMLGAVLLALIGVGVVAFILMKSKQQAPPEM